MTAELLEQALSEVTWQPQLLPCHYHTSELDTPLSSSAVVRTVDTLDLLSLVQNNLKPQTKLIVFYQNSAAR